MTIKQLILAFSFLVISAGGFGQVEESVTPGESKQENEASIKYRWILGGDLGLSFGTITYIKLAPELGYRFTTRFSAGLGPIYIYERYKGVNDFESSTFGGKAVASFIIFKSVENGGRLRFGDILLHAENEYIGVEPLLFNPSTNEFLLDNLLLGAGVSIPVSERFTISMYLLWDVTQNPNTLYANPTLKYGFYYHF
jgi:hypothetical protein